MTNQTVTFPKGRRRGMLNEGSIATEYDWRWEDFSGVLDFLCEEYTRPDRWPVCVFDLLKLDPEKVNLNLPGILAERECLLNGWDGDVGTSSTLFGYLTNGGQVYLDRMIMWLLPFAVLELETGEDCELHLVHGINRYVYPRLLKGLRFHGYEKDQ